MIDSSSLIPDVINFLLMEITGYIDDFIRWVSRLRITSKEDNEEQLVPEKTIDENGRPKPYLGKPKSYLG